MFRKTWNPRRSEEAPEEPRISREALQSMMAWGTLVLALVAAMVVLAWASLG